MEIDICPSFHTVKAAPARKRFGITRFSYLNSSELHFCKLLHLLQTFANFCIFCKLLHRRRDAAKGREFLHRAEKISNILIHEKKGSAPLALLRFRRIISPGGAFFRTFRAKPRAADNIPSRKKKLYPHPFAQKDAAEEFPDSDRQDPPCSFA